MIRMSDSGYLEKLVDLMPRKLANVIEKDGTTTGYQPNDEINLFFVHFWHFFIYLSSFSDRPVMFFSATL